MKNSERTSTKHESCGWWQEQYYEEQDRWQWEWPPSEEYPAEQVEEHAVAGVAGPFVTLKGVAFTSGSPRWESQWAEMHQRWYKWEEQDKATEDGMERWMPAAGWRRQWDQGNRDRDRWKE